MRSKGDSPTFRSLKLLREMGYQADVVERWIPHSGRRADLFGFVDIVAIHPTQGFLFVQATTSPHAAARADKIENAEAAPHCVYHGAVVEVWGWGKRGPQGSRKVWKVNRYRAKLIEGSQAVVVRRVGDEEL